jgi:phosphoglycolate phosphatase
VLLLFDIDGTLLQSRQAGVRALTAAGQDVVHPDFTLEGLPIGGRLDPLIIKDALDAIGASPHHLPVVRASYIRHLQARFDAGHPAAPLPGVEALLAACRARTAWTLGLVTGNFPESGAMKLQAAGLALEQFTVQAWGDEGLSRNHLPAKALQMHANSDPSRTVVIGDTLADIECGRANGCSVIAVATGACTRAQLECGQPDLLLDDLADTGTVMSWLERMAA